MPNGFFFKGPAGSAAGPAGPQQQSPQGYRPGLPPQHLPGYTNARTAEQARRGVAGVAPPDHDLSHGEKCFVEYMARRVRDGLIDGLVNIQQVARGPSHIQVPYSGICFQRHKGSGADPAGLGGHPDLPTPLPFVGVGGAFTELVGFVVDQGSNGVVNCLGANIFPGDPATRGAIEFRVVVNGQVVAPFSSAQGSVVPNADGTWFGFPGSVEDPNRDVCLNLFPNDNVIFQARNSFGGPIAVISASALMCGWTYWPTMQTSDRTIRGTMTDQR
jgi:hypothetical protein